MKLHSHTLLVSEGCVVSFLGSNGNSAVITENEIDLELPYTPPPPSHPGDFSESLYKMLQQETYYIFCSTQAVGVFMIFWVKRDESMQKSPKLGNHF